MSSRTAEASAPPASPGRAHGRSATWVMPGELWLVAAGPTAQPRRIRVVTTAPQRHFVVDAAEAVALLTGTEEGDLPTITMPAEAFIRLVYGRLDRQHTPALETTDVDLDDLRAIFRGV